MSEQQVARLQPASSTPLLGVAKQNGKFGGSMDPVDLLKGDVPDMTVAFFEDNGQDERRLRARRSLDVLDRLLFRVRVDVV